MQNVGGENVSPPLLGSSTPFRKENNMTTAGWEFDFSPRPSIIPNRTIIT